MAADERLVPKVLPTSREIEADDPMEIVAHPVPGDPELMLECIVEEYAHLGWTAEQLLMLFRSPYYPLLNELMRFFGEDETRQRIESHLNICGVFRVSETIAEPDEDEHEHEPELVQLSIRTTR